MFPTQWQLQQGNKHDNVSQEDVTLEADQLLFWDFPSSSYSGAVIKSFSPNCNTVSASIIVS